jgi:RNA polymerase sigma factor (sigma-70 family)
MQLVDVSKTRTSQLRAIRDWSNHLAWVGFQRKYDPLLRDCCKNLRLDEKTAGEICQLTWIEVARRIESFVYDPTKSFRGWLRVVCLNKARDYRKKAKIHAVFPLEERDEPHHAGPFPNISEVVTIDDDRDEDPAIGLLWRRAEAVQAAVRARVQPQTWEAFWLLAVSDWDLEETVRALGISHASAYKAKQRVMRHLKEEGRLLCGGDST